MREYERGTFVWYVKWFACFMVLLSVAVRSVEEIPQIYDVIFSFVGTIAWFYVGWKWNDRAFLLLNGVLLFLLGTALLRYIVNAL
jgi:hypothetical protein